MFCTFMTNFLLISYFVCFILLLDEVKAGGVETEEFTTKQGFTKKVEELQEYIKKIYKRS